MEMKQVKTPLFEDWLNGILGAERSMGNCRRVVRFGKIFTLLQTILVGAPMKYNYSVALLLLEVLRNFVLIMYHYYDHIYWFIFVGLIKKLDGNHYSRGAAVCWFISVLISLQMDTIKLFDNIRKKNTLKDRRARINREGGDGWQQGINEVDKAMKAINEERIELFWNYIRNITDFPLGLTGTLQLRNMPQWLLGLCGVISSAIGLHQTWKQKISMVPPPKFAGWVSYHTI